MSARLLQQPKPDRPHPAPQATLLPGGTGTKAGAATLESYVGPDIMLHAESVIGTLRGVGGGGVTG